MASFFKQSGLSSNMNPTELDRAIHNLEFEKQQQIKELEKEQQQIAVLEATLREKEDGIRSLEIYITRLDEETKTHHRQFRQNKDNRESLKKHLSVLHSHLESVEKKLQLLAQKYKAENVQHGDTLSHYDAIHKSYEEVYMQQASAQELMRWQLEVLQRKEAIKEGHQHVARLQQEIVNQRADIKDNEPPYQSINEFVIKIAEIKLSTMMNSSQIEKELETISSAEKEAVLLREKQAEILKKIQEKKKQEELERQRKSQEKAQQEKTQDHARVMEQRSSNGQSGVYKFGQFIHKAPAPSQPPASLAPKRSTHPLPPSSPRNPIMIPIPARVAPKMPTMGLISAPPAKYSVPQSAVGATAGAGSTPSKAPSMDKFLLNVPPRSPRQPRTSHSHVRAGEMHPKQVIPSVSRPLTGGMAPKPSLTATLQHMSLQTQQPIRIADPSQQPIRSSAASQQPISNCAPNLQPIRSSAPSQTTPTAGAVQPCLPMSAANTMDTGSEGSGPLMGPGGDAQPCPETACNQPQVPETNQYNSPSQTAATLYYVEENARMETNSEFSSTPQGEADVSCSSPMYPRTPESGGSGTNLEGLPAKLHGEKSPGFIYSFRSMFGDQEDAAAAGQEQDKTAGSDGGGNFSDNPFFHSFFEMGRSSSEQAAMSNPANMFGDGGFGANGNSQSESSKTCISSGSGNNNGGGGAMAMFGDSPAPTPSVQSPSPGDQQGSMGFNISFSDSMDASQDSGSGAGNGSGKSGFCLF